MDGSDFEDRKVSKPSPVLPFDVSNIGDLSQGVHSPLGISHFDSKNPTPFGRSTKNSVYEYETVTPYSRFKVDKKFGSATSVSPVHTKAEEPGLGLTPMNSADFSNKIASRYRS
ncbi:hypothetical protein POMI540_2586 [Schizosaccharomyces pombe]